MSSLFPSGLPEELNIEEELAKEETRIKIKVKKKKFGKLVTIIEGIDEKSFNMKELTRFLKKKLACGGTFKEGRIELQGDHRNRVVDLLVQKGFKREQIEVL